MNHIQVIILAIILYLFILEIIQLSCGNLSKEKDNEIQYSSNKIEWWGWLMINVLLLLLFIYELGNSIEYRTLYISGK